MDQLLPNELALFHSGNGFHTSFKLLQRGEQEHLPVRMKWFFTSSDFAMLSKYCQYVFLYRGFLVIKQGHPLG